MEASESIGPHMALLGLSELACLAAEKIPVTHSIQLGYTESSWKIGNHSSLGNKVRVLQSGVETPETQSDGSVHKITLDVVSPHKIVIRTTFRLGKLEDAREVVAGGAQLVQTTVLRASSGGEHTTQRVYNRV